MVESEKACDLCVRERVWMLSMGISLSSAAECESEKEDEAM